MDLDGDCEVDVDTCSLSGCWLQRRRRNRQILAGKAPAVVLKQDTHALCIRRANDQPGVVMLLHSIHNLRRVKHRRIGLCRPGETENATRMLLASLRKRVWNTAQRANLDPRPFCPQIDAGSLLDYIGDEGSAHTSRDLKEVETAIGGADIFGMCDTAHEAHGRYQLRVNCLQFTRIGGIPIDDPGGKHAALVHHLHGRLAVLAHGRKDYLPVVGDRVDVEDGAGNESLEEIVALAVAQLIKRTPELLRLMNLAYADGGGFGTGLQHPGSRYFGHVSPQIVVIQHGSKFRNQYPGSCPGGRSNALCLEAHG